MNDFFKRTIYRTKRRLIQKVININKFLSRQFEYKIKISQPKLVLRDCFLEDELFSTSKNFLQYVKSNPYWLVFKDITLKKVGHYHENTEVIGKGILINEKNEIILDSTIGQLEYLNKLNFNHFIFFRKILKRRTIEKAIVLSNYLENNYYHWVLESIGRLVIIPSNKIKEYNIVLDQNSKPFIKESLNFLFNIPTSQLIYKKKFTRLKIKDTIIPSFPQTRNESTSFTNIYSPTVLKKINSLSKQKSRKLKIQNFIISREKCSQRKILNEKILLMEFPNLNFEIVILEELTFEQQLNLFANANIIIATHGAGLANLLFSVNPMIIEFFPKNRNIRDAFYFYQISQALNFEHYIIEYDSTDFSQDIILDANLINKLKTILNNSNKVINNKY